jgi:hypothetical protein
MTLAIREGGNEAVHEAEELDTTAPLGVRRDDPSGGDFERREQGCGAMPRIASSENVTKWMAVTRSLMDQH